LLIWSFGDVTVASPVTSTGLGFREGIGDLQALTKGTGGERGILRAPDKHRAILRFLNEFQLGCAVFALTMAHSTIRILPEMVAKW
jgi:hypothetical protein